MPHYLIINNHGQKLSANIKRGDARINGVLAGSVFFNIF
jgi:hypothetical protein